MIFEWLKTLELPKGSDLALWWIGVIAIAAIYKIPDPTVVVGNLASGLIGYLGGKNSA